MSAWTVVDAARIKYLRERDATLTEHERLELRALRMRETIAAVDRRVAAFKVLR